MYMVIIQVQADQLLAKFQSLHHLFFVVRKLLKDVVTSQQSPVDIKEASQPVKSLSEGGFLRQPNSNYVPVRQPESSANIVDFNSWEKFSYLLSAITLPFLLKCLKDGMDLANSKHCQVYLSKLFHVNVSILVFIVSLSVAIIYFVYNNFYIYFCFRCFMLSLIIIMHILLLNLY